MKSGAEGGSWRTREDVLPKDAIVYNDVDSWRIFLSKKTECLIFDTMDYHPGLLFLTKSDLVEALKMLSEEEHTP